MARFHTTAEGNIPFTPEEEVECDEREAAHIALKAATAYSISRAAEYPPIGDQLDALFHAGVFPADMAATLQAIKNKYPKP